MQANKIMGCQRAKTANNPKWILKIITKTILKKGKKVVSIMKILKIIIPVLAHAAKPKKKIGINKIREVGVEADRIPLSKKKKTVKKMQKKKTKKIKTEKKIKNP